MLSVLRSAWPLLLGVLLLMVGNGMQGTLLGIRGAIEGFSTGHMALVMAGYYGGFVLGSMLVPGMIQRVGHVRVFAALGSLISAVLILYAAAPNWLVWALMRVVIGFSFSGVYITAESWLNATASNDKRGQAMSVYMIVQMMGLVSGQVLMNLADPAGYLLFVIPSVLVSLAFTPILLSPQPAPHFESLRPMSVGRLLRVSPLGCVGMFLIGGVIAGLFGMAPVWGAAQGLDVSEVSAFVAAIYIGGLLLQYPIGWLSDRMDRRIVITGLAVLGALVVAAAVVVKPGIWGLLLTAALVGGIVNPVYSLLIAYTNDFLATSEMAGASAGLLFVNGIGAFAGPMATAWLMGVLGNDGFWIYNGVLLAALAAFGGWRMTRRAAPPVEAQGHFAVLSPSASALAVEVALSEADEAARRQAESGSTGGDDPDAEAYTDTDTDAAGADSRSATSPAAAGSAAHHTITGGSMMMTESNVTPEEILGFWLDEVGPKGWYVRDDALDARIREAFLPAWHDAEQLAAAWAGTAEGALATLILTDQFPRNMFRDDARAFATDALARRVAEAAIAEGHDLATPEPARQFFYMPFEHSEELADQDRAVALFAERMPGENLLHARLHRQAIARFGRFPWRNAALGRESTPAEVELLEAGGYGALVSGEVSLVEAE